MEKRVFLVHGWEGKPDNHWFPWLTWELRSRGFEVYSVTLPHADEPKMSEWIPAIKDVVGRPNKDTYFVGHSLGCAAIIRYLETLPPKAEIGGAVFVAGFHQDLGIVQIQDFFQSSIDLEKAKKHSNKFICIFSDNDKYVSPNQSFEFAKGLGAKMIMEKDKQHFMKSEGVDALPSVFQSLIKMSSQ